jgi:hypothetical protein
MKLRDLLMFKNSDELLELVRLLGGGSAIRRKAERVDYIEKRMLDPDSLYGIWHELDAISRRAVSAAYHRGGEFSPQAFVAQYGQLPERFDGERTWFYRAPILLDLFVIGDQIPDDMMPLLEKLVLPLEPFRLEGIADVPSAVKLDDQTRSVTIVETETNGRSDLLTYLQLLDRNKLKFGTQTRRLTDTSLRTVLANLVSGDYRDPPQKATSRTTIRPTGLEVFTQESGLVSRYGALTKSGRDYLRTQDPELLLVAFETWTDAGEFDELRRITSLKGLNSKNTRLTPPASRRDKVIEALSWCPAGRWIDIGSFYRALLIWDLDFEVEENPYSNLTVGAGYYAESLRGGDYWLIAHGLYVNVVIWEYLATIGAVDIAFLTEEYVELLDDYYMDFDEPFSLYDGLLYFRINPWGAYLLGLADEYVPSEPVDNDLFTIDRNRKLTFFKSPAPNVRLQMELIANPVDDLHYQLDQVKLLDAVEDGRNIDHITEFLRENHSGELPAEISAWLSTLKQNLGAFSHKGDAVLVRVKPAEVMRIVEGDDVLAKVSQPLDNNTLLVLSGNLSRFKNRLKTLGYLLKK